MKRGNEMDKLIHILYDYIVEYIVRILGVLLVSTVLMQIFTRIFFKVPFSWTDELARFTFIWYCFLGSVLTMYNKLHLGIDYFESKMKAKTKYYNRVFVYITQIVFSLLLSYYGFTLLGIVGFQKSPIMRLQMKYIYFVLPLTGLLYLILGINELKQHLNSKNQLIVENTTIQ
jgi:TRAP-type C4-dicarboxylate transport system permease small subunit